MLNGCATMTQRTFTDRSISDEDELFVLDMGRAKVIHDTYVLTAKLPATDALAEGMPSREVFQTLGKATAICVDMMGMPPRESQVNFGHQSDDPLTEWSTCAFWKLAEVQGKEVHLLEITARFKKTLPRSEQNTLGNPLRPDGDEGWKIKSISVSMNREPL